MIGEGIVPTVNLATGNGSNSGNGGFGFGDGAWWIVILFLFVFCGWGNGFGGNNGGSTGGGSVMDAYVLNSDFATLQRLMSDGFNTVNSGINQVNQGICNLGYSTLENFNTTNMGVATGFANLNNALCNQSFQIERGITNLGSQLAQCCCNIESGIQGINYNNAMNTNAIQNSMCLNTRDIIDSQNAGTRAILDSLAQAKLEAKNEQIQAQQNEINALRLAASQERQNAYLVSELGPKQPVPAYPVFPTTSFAYPTGVSFGINGLNGYNNGCGCGCC